MNQVRHQDRSSLDNPVWAALTTRQTALGCATSTAARYFPDVAPFAGAAHTAPDALLELATLVVPGGHALILNVEPLPPIEGLRAEHLFLIRQMVDEHSPSSGTGHDVIRLGASDASDMLELARATQPGPFGARTHEMGNYIGIRDNGRLVAMAGERMRLDGFTEISAVCVEEGYRGRGIAAHLMNALRREMRERGETPFLHVRDDNASAIGLYQRLGFETRKVFHLYRVAR